MLYKYQELPKDIKEIIDDELDLYVYNELIKPSQNCLIAELKWFFEPKCELCYMPLMYIDYTGEFVYYLRTHGLCIRCMNDATESDEDSMDFDEWYENASTTSERSVNTV